MPDEHDDEPEDAGADHETPVELTEAWEALEYERLCKLGPNE